MYKMLPWFLGLLWRHRLIVTLLIAILVLTVLLIVEELTPRKVSDTPIGVPSIDTPRPTPIVFTDVNRLVQEKPDQERLAALVRLSQSVEQPEPKGEFETGAEYQQRLTSFAPPVGRYPRSTQFAIVLPASATYDIDAGVLKVSTNSGVVAVSPRSEPTVTLLTENLPATSYAGQNAFGVSRRVEMQVQKKIVLIPIAQRKAPPGCDFSAGLDRSSKTLVDGASLIAWACGSRKIRTEDIENFAAFGLKMPVAAAKIARSGPLYVAYVVSFELPAGLNTHAGPMTYSHERPTINNPIDRRVVGEAMTARLKRTIVFGPKGKVWFDRQFD